MFIKKWSYFLANKKYKKKCKNTKYWYYEKYQYRIFSLVEMSILLGISIFFNIVSQMVLVFIGYAIIRSFRAKNHLDSYSKCIIFSTIWIISFSLISNNYTAIIFGLFAGYIIDTKVGSYILKNFDNIYCFITNIFKLNKVNKRK